MRPSQQYHSLTKAFALSTAYRMLAHHRPFFLFRWIKLLQLTISYHFLSFYFGDAPRWRLWLRKRNAHQRMTPNYIMTGPIKSGSSDFSLHLLLHPNVLPPLCKEFHFGRNWQAYYPTLKEQQAVEQATNHKALTGYLFPHLHNMALMDRLHKANPHAKVIITLRDPVKRAYSHWKWELFVGGSNPEAQHYFKHYDQYVERALEYFPVLPIETVCGSFLLETGIYYKAVEKWIVRFGREKVLVLDVQDYFTDRSTVMKKVQAFLELPTVDIPHSEMKINENPLVLQPADEATQAKLSAFYRPYNEKLFELLGERFDWM